MNISYIRCSTIEQNTIRQEVLMESLGVDEVYIDKASGKDTNRPALQEMLDFIDSYYKIQQKMPQEKKEQLTLIVESISRFARNTKDLLELIDFLNKRDVKFVSQKESIDTSTATGKFMLTIFGAVSELEREYIKQRQGEGIAIAKTIPGKYKGKPKIDINEKQFAKVYKEWKQGLISGRQAMQRLGLKPNTFYRRVKEYEQYIEKDTTK